MLGISGSRDIRFTNSQFRTIPLLLKTGSKAVVDIHPEDATAQGFAEGDRVTIETPKGAVEMTARISTTVRPGMVRLARGWGDNRRSMVGGAECIRVGKR
jgi:anaerobic selenocysteine-containing dehydrogenase